MSTDKTDIKDFFGVNVRQEFAEYIRDVFTPWFLASYGSDNRFAGFILDPCQTPVWHEPANTTMLRFSTADMGRSLDLMTNVRGKARFSLREGLPSSEASQQKWRVRAGDFPYAGFLFYKGYWVGGSGVKQESDEFLCRKIIDKGLIPIMERAVQKVIDIVEQARARNIEVGDWKFLDGTPEELEAIIKKLEQIDQT